MLGSRFAPSLVIPHMGIDFLDCCIRIEKEFNLPRKALDVRKLDAPRSARGGLVGATAGDVARWVEACMVAQGSEPPPDLWPRVRGCIAATVYESTENVTPTSRIVEDLGFT
jgi:hypothetical protein